MKKIIYMFLVTTILVISIAKGDNRFPILTLEQTHPFIQGMQQGMQTAHLFKTQQLQNQEQEIKNQYRQEELNNIRLRNEMYRRALQSQPKLAMAKGGAHYAQPHVTRSSQGGTHYVRPYVKKNGTYVQGHLSGNPGSGIHCHNNVCR